MRKLSQYYVTVRLSVPLTKQFREAPFVTVQRFVCVSVATTTSQGKYCRDQSKVRSWVRFSEVSIRLFIDQLKHRQVHIEGVVDKVTSTTKTI